MQLYHTYFNLACFFSLNTFLSFLFWWWWWGGGYFIKFFRHLNYFGNVQPCLCEQINFKMCVSIPDSGKRIRVPVPWRCKFFHL